ncbi:MAG: TrkH family potassium uptake protein [Bacteroidetes bacterium]|jgi:trk system potassium uptake protein TrkH|nr:TrkH family potassium uptake protein [Bacteroidota bacterium]
MVNFRVVTYILGFLLFIEGLFMMLAAPVSLIYDNSDAETIFYCSLLTVFIGLSFFLWNRKCTKNIGKREGYLIVTLGWVVFSFFGALPFYFTNAIPNFTNAFFETISGFTTTGASILTDIESLSQGILFWRSLTQWLGGMGIIVLSLAILPVLGIGGMQLFIAEVPGPTPDKIHPRVRETAKRLWGIYVIFTFLEVILLVMGGMNLFDAVCHSFTTMATGGYSTKQDSIAYFDSPYIQYVITFFMFIAGVNFALSYFALHFRFNKVWKNEEFRFFLGIILVFTLFITLNLVIDMKKPLEESFRESLFQVVSILTTTGFVTADYLSWRPFVVVLIFILMFFGGSAGSTGGGMKVIRIALLLKNSFLELKRLMHPNAIVPVRFDGNAVNQQIITNVLAFASFYLLTFVISSIVMSTMNYDLVTSMGAVAASLGNIGPGLGAVGPMENFAHIPVFGKWFLAFLMLIGRLEIFTVLLLFSPHFWRK